MVIEMYSVRAVFHYVGICLLVALTMSSVREITTHAQTRPPVTEREHTDAATTEADPVIGTWELDVAASTFDPGPPTPAMLFGCEK